MKCIDDKIFPETMPKQDRQKILACALKNLNIQVQAYADKTYIEIDKSEKDLRDILKDVAHIEGIKWEEKPSFKIVSGSTIDMDSCFCYIADYDSANTNLNELFSTRREKDGTIIFVPYVNSNALLKSPDESD